MITNSGGLVAAWDRYRTLEAWQYQALPDAAIQHDPRCADLCPALLPRLAETGQASIWLLTTGTQNLAALVRFQQGATVSERLCAADPDLVLSVTTAEAVLRRHALQALSDGDPIDVHIMGSSRPVEQRPDLHPPYPDRRRAWSLMVWNTPCHYRPLLGARAAVRGWVTARRGKAGAPARCAD